jgi:hypothetical protein
VVRIGRTEGLDFKQLPDSIVAGVIGQIDQSVFFDGQLAFTAPEAMAVPDRAAQPLTTASGK